MNNVQPLDEQYLHWLYSQVADPEQLDPSLSYWNLIRALYTKEFVWFVPNDGNRAVDGKTLRREFEHDHDLFDIDREWSELPCSVLELLIGLSRRMSFQMDGEPYYWFWRIIDNLGLLKFNDRGRFPKRIVNNIVNTALQRHYDKDGRGGFFPLQNPSRDQRKVEIWYQLAAWMNEQS